MGYLGIARFVELLQNLTHLFSFFGIEEEAALVVDDEIQASLDFYVHFKRLRPWQLN